APVPLASSLAIVGPAAPITNRESLVGASEKRKLGLSPVGIQFVSTAPEPSALSLARCCRVVPATASKGPETYKFVPLMARSQNAYGLVSMSVTLASQTWSTPPVPVADSLTRPLLPKPSNFVK